MAGTRKSLSARIGRVIRDKLCEVIPVVQDSSREWVRKCAFLLAFFIFIGSTYCLVDELVWQPQKTQGTLNTLRDWYHSEGSVDDLPPGTVDTTVYPDGMDDAFKPLYRHNDDVRGWLTFAAGSNDLFEGAIDNPVVQAEDNDYYLNRDFWGEKDKAGTLFFDYRNNLSATGSDRNLIIYGHNLTSGLMFSRFILLASGKIDRGRRLTTMTMDTLYEKATYKVFAVMVLNVDESEGPVFRYLRTGFSDENSFLKFVEEVRRRSVYDFGDVDVQAGDQLLTLSTCSNRRDSHLKNGRIVVMARKVREGESTKVDTGKTVVNEDVLMPKAWYTNQKLELPDEYKDGTETTPSDTTTGSGDTTDTVPSDSTGPSGDGGTTTTVPSGDTTTPSGGVTDPSTETTDPSGEVTEPSGETTEPSGETTEPSGETTEPSGEITEPTDSQTETADTTTTIEETVTTEASTETTTVPET